MTGANPDNEEKWRPIPGYERLYEISDGGRVKSLARTVTTRSGRARHRPEAILDGYLNRSGRVGVRLTSEPGTSRMHMMHDLVLEAFVGPRPTGLRASHRDGNHANNKLSNLHWSTSLPAVHELILEMYESATFVEIGAEAGVHKDVVAVHARRMQAAGILAPGRKAVHIPRCRVTGCGNDSFGLGMCESHFHESERRRFGDHPLIAPGDEWRSIPDFPGYEVHYTGLVRNRSGHHLSPRVRASGHLNVNLFRDGDAHHRFIHRLVLESFVGPCPEGYISCHRDGDPANNYVDNLYWGTFSDNQLDQALHGGHPRANRTFCINGHEYSESGYVTYNESRHCIPCRQANRDRHEERKRAIDISGEIA